VFLVSVDIIFLRNFSFGPCLIGRLFSKLLRVAKNKKLKNSIFQQNAITKRLAGLNFMHFLFNVSFARFLR
jgi:hypothetical protein